MLKNLLFLLLLTGVFFTVNSFAQLDLTFNGTGKRFIQFTSSGTTHDMVIQPDNKIILVGNCLEFGQPRAFCTIRLNEDGSFDTTFGGGLGYVIANISGPSATFASQGVVVQNDGKIIVAGSSPTGMLVIRYNSNGSLDTTFGTGGVVQNQFTLANKVIMQPDGKILVVGYNGAISTNFTQFIARYLSNGTLDGTFGTGGLATVSIPGNRTIGSSIDLQPDGKIVTGGSAANGSTTQYMLARLNRNGSPDTTFDGDGVLTIDSGVNFFPDTGSLISVAVKTDGRIVALGDRNVIYSFNPDGSFDTTFDGDGSRTALAGAEIYALTVRASGKILVAGNPIIATNFPTINYRSAAYLADGTIDPNFATPDIDLTGTDGATAVLFDRKGRALFGGRTSFGSILNAPWNLPLFSAARFAASPSQNVGFSGRVVDLDGKPIRNALITLKDGNTTVANTRTNSFGYFRFQSVATNQTYTISTISKGKNFYDRSVMVDDPVANYLLVGE